MLWQLSAEYQSLAAEFGSLEAVFTLEGERITHDPISELIKVTRQGVDFYVKRYRNNGKGLRAWLPTTRIQAEWQNLQRFKQWGIATAEVIAYGQERRYGKFIRGAMITRGLPSTADLAHLANQQDPRLQDPQWVAQVSQQVAEMTRILHQHRFAHNDLKWRNLLVNHQGKVFLIDCPTGRFWCWPFLQRRLIKDLACLDKVASEQLSRTQRLRFYLAYRQQSRLTRQDKGYIRQIVHYFKGRE